MVEAVGGKKRYPVQLYAIDNTSTYKNAFTRNELIAALYRAEQKIKREFYDPMADIIPEAIKEYFDSLGP